MKAIGRMVVRTVDYVFFGLMILILFAAVLSFSETIHSGWLKYVIAFATVILVGVLVVFGNSVIQKIKSLLNFVCNLSTLQMCGIIFAFVSVTKIFFVFLLDTDATKHPDMANYQSFAFQLAEDGKITQNIFSAFMWKYEVIYGWFLSPAVKLFGQDTKVMLTYLSVQFAILSVLLFDVIRFHIGKNKSFVMIMLFNLLPVGLFETQLLIHETALLFFYIVSFWLLTKSINRENHVIVRAAALVLSALLIAFGNKINQGGTVVIISYCIYVFVMFCKEGATLKSTAAMGVSIVCYLLCFVVVSHLCVSFVNHVVILSDEEKQKVEQIQANAVPFGWGLYLGSNIEKPGEWNEEDASVYYKYQEIPDQQEAKQYQLDLIDGRLKVFKENPAIIPVHLFNKIKGLWGSSFLPFSYELGNSVNEFILTGAHGMIYKTVWGISELGYIALCAVIVFSHRRHKNGVADTFFSPVTQMKMVVVGITFVLLLFEVMPKYASHMHIVLSAVGMMNIDAFMNTSERINKRLFRVR